MRARLVAPERIDSHSAHGNLEHAGELADVAFYRNLVCKLAPAAVLELGCGSGHVTIPLAEEALDSGYTIVGLDPSADLLAFAHQRLLAKPSAVRARVCLLRGDVRQYRCPGAFDLVIMPFGAPSHLCRLQDQLDVWWHMHESLRPGGCFVVDATATDFTRDSRPHRRPSPDNDEGFAAEELELLFRASGFDVEAVYDGYEFRPTRASSSGCVIIGRKGI